MDGRWAKNLRVLQSWMWQHTLWIHGEFQDSLDYMARLCQKERKKGRRESGDRKYEGKERRWKGISKASPVDKRRKRSSGQVQQSCLRFSPVAVIKYSDKAQRRKGFFGSQFQVPGLLWQGSHTHPQPEQRADACTAQLTVSISDNQESLLGSGLSPQLTRASPHQVLSSEQPSQTVRS